MIKYDKIAWPEDRDLQTKATENCINNDFILAKYAGLAVGQKVAVTDTE